MNYSEGRTKLIDLSAITDEAIREKAAAINAKYLAVNDQAQKLKTQGLGDAAQAVINLKNIVENNLNLDSEVNIMTAKILAFNLETLAFPENFDVKTGKFRS